MQQDRDVTHEFFHMRVDAIRKGFYDKKYKFS